MRLSLLDNRLGVLQFLDSEVSIPKYTVTWINDDESVLRADANSLEGSMPSYGNISPTKASTDTHWYEFTGWEPEIGPVTGDITYKAVYIEHLITKQVTWRNYDGSDLKVEDIPINQTPVYQGNTPIKPSTPDYRYIFNGWDPEIGPVTRDIVYTAVFTEVANTVKATFVRAAEDGGGTLEVQNSVPYNTEPVYGGSKPTTTKGADPIYTFEGWKPPLGPITEDTVFTAVFNDNRPLTIQFLDRSLKEFDSTSEEHYVPPKYTVTWNNYNGAALEIDKEVPIGTKPTYDGPTPTRPNSGIYRYEFKTWDKEIVPVTGDVTYTAVFSEILITHEIIFKLAEEDGGTVLETKPAVTHSTTPVYTGVTPTTIRGGADQYAFDGWTPAIGPALDDAVYVARFKELGSKTIQFLERTLTVYES